MMNAMTPAEIAEAAYTPGGPSKNDLVKLAEARQARKPQHPKVSMTNTKSPGDQWKLALSIAKPRPLPIPRGGVPTDPGVYIWYRDESPIYVGEALGAEGLRGRLRKHFAKGTDLSRSTLRASVAAAQLGVPRSVARQRPSVMTVEQVAVVNRWLAACELGWIQCEGTKEAHEWELRLRGEWLPPLNLV